MFDIRAYLLANGFTEEQLDEFVELPVVRDIGQALTLAFQRIDDLEQRIQQLEGGGSGA